MRVLDAHLHVWDLEAGDYPWLGPQHGPLHRTIGPDEAAAELAAAGVDTAVLVQAEDSTAETRRLLDVADRHAFVHGVVGWVRLDDPDEATRQLDELDGTALVGVRHLVHDDPRDDLLDLPAVRASAKELAVRGLPLDVPDAWPRHLAAAARLADAVPELTVVLDHLGKPPRGSDAMAPWERSLRAFAARPNTVAKLSGLQVEGQPMTVAALQPVVDTALDAFGSDRLMQGSDWPMTLPHGGYLATHVVLAALVDALSPEEQSDVWHRTATTTYRRHDA